MTVHERIGAGETTSKEERRGLETRGLDRMTTAGMVTAVDERATALVAAGAIAISTATAETTGETVAEDSIASTSRTPSRTGEGRGRGTGHQEGKGREEETGA